MVQALEVSDLTGGIGLGGDTIFGGATGGTFTGGTFTGGLIDPSLGGLIGGITGMSTVNQGPVTIVRRPGKSAKEERSQYGLSKNHTAIPNTVTLTGPTGAATTVSRISLPDTFILNPGNVLF